MSLWLYVNASVHGVAIISERGIDVALYVTEEARMIPKVVGYEFQMRRAGVLCAD